MSGLRGLDDNSVLREYIALKAEKERIEERLEELKPAILGAVLNEPGNKGYYMGMEFSVQRRRRWSYSDAVVQMETNLKAAKRFEEATGVAILEDEPAYLVVKAAKYERI